MRRFLLLPPVKRDVPPWPRSLQRHRHTFSSWCNHEGAGGRGVICSVTTDLLDKAIWGTKLDGLVKQCGYVFSLQPLLWGPGRASACVWRSMDVGINTAELHYLVSRDDSSASSLGGGASQISNRNIMIRWRQTGFHQLARWLREPRGSDGSGSSNSWLWRILHHQTRLKVQDLLKSTNVSESSSHREYSRTHCGSL